MSQTKGHTIVVTLRVVFISMDATLNGTEPFHIPAISSMKRAR